jgi:hypothetical protein
MISITYAEPGHPCSFRPFVRHNGAGAVAAKEGCIWLPYAGITRIRFKGFSCEISVRFTHTPSL